jgi:hypothetical protein
MPAPESGVFRKLLPRTRGKTVKLLRGIHRGFIAACSPRAAESQKTVHLRDAFVYTGEALFGARERKDEIVGTIAEPRKGALWRLNLRGL